MKTLRLRAVDVTTAQPIKTVNLLNPQFKYVPAAKTDILKRFRDMGWVPPSEKKGAL
jgi:hypothetical protein